MYLLLNVLLNDTLLSIVAPIYVLKVAYIGLVPVRAGVVRLVRAVSTSGTKVS